MLGKRYELIASAVWQLASMDHQVWKFAQNAEATEDDWVELAEELGATEESKLVIISEELESLGFLEEVRVLDSRLEQIENLDAETTKELQFLIADINFATLQLLLAVLAGSNTGFSMN